MTDATIIPSILEDAPAVVKDDWLPADSEFPELTELATEHRETLADLRDISSAIHALRAKYQAEDDAALEAQRRAYATGEEPQIPKRTSNQTREKAMQELQERGVVVQIPGGSRQRSHRHGPSEPRRLVRNTPRARTGGTRPGPSPTPAVGDGRGRSSTGTRPPRLVGADSARQTRPVGALGVVAAREADTGSARHRERRPHPLQQHGVRCASTELNGGGVDTDTTGVPTYGEEVADYSLPEYKPRSKGTYSGTFATAGLATTHPRRDVRHKQKGKTMTLNRTEIMKRDELLRRAVAEGKVVQNSTLYQTLSDVFSIRPQVAEEMVAQLTPNPLAAASNGIVRIGVATTPQADTYESGWPTVPSVSASRTHKQGTNRSAIPSSDVGNFRHGLGARAP